MAVETLKNSTKRCLEDFIKATKTDSRAQAFCLDDYVHDLMVTFEEAAECCVVKGKCFHSSLYAKVRKTTRDEDNYRN